MDAGLNVQKMGENRLFPAKSAILILTIVMFGAPVGGRRRTGCRQPIPGFSWHRQSILSRLFGKS
jgi:hypothetical protein